MTDQSFPCIPMAVYVVCTTAVAYTMQRGEMWVTCDALPNSRPIGIWWHWTREQWRWEGTIRIMHLLSKTGRFTRPLTIGDRFTTGHWCWCIAQFESFSANEITFFRYEDNCAWKNWCINACSKGAKGKRGLNNVDIRCKSKKSSKSYWFPRSSDVQARVNSFS